MIAAPEWRNVLEDGEALSAVYLITFAAVLEETAQNATTPFFVISAHPQRDRSDTGVTLKAPSSYTKQQMVEAMLDAVGQTQGSRATPLRLLRLAVFREKHSHGEWHDHVAMLASWCFRFLPLKRCAVQEIWLWRSWQEAANAHLKLTALSCELAALSSQLRALGSELRAWSSDPSWSEELRAWS